MLPVLYIHIGLHKTATSTLQYAILQNIRVLRNQGIRVLNGHQLFFAELGLFDDATEDIIRAGRQFFSDMRQQYDETTFVLSYEGFSGNMTKGHSNVVSIAPNLHTMLDGLFTPKIVVYLRRQDELCESIYIQTVHQGDPLQFHEFLVLRP